MSKKKELSAVGHLNKGSEYFRKALEQVEYAGLALRRKKPGCAGCVELKEQVERAEKSESEQASRANGIVRAVHHALDEIGAPKLGSLEIKEMYPDNISYISYEKRMHMFGDRLKELETALDSIATRCGNGDGIILDIVRVALKRKKT